MKDPIIFQLYTAANSFEAYAVAEALEREGIEARVVGNHLKDTAAGRVPLGQPIAPAVWIRKADADRANALLETWYPLAESPPEEPLAPETEDAGDEEPSPEEITEEAGAAEELPPQVSRVSLLSLLLGLAGVASIAFGILFAGINCTI